MRTKLSYVIIAALIFAVLTFGALIFIRRLSPKDDNYYWNKYHDLKDHDACVTEFNKYNAGQQRLIGLPCPGEPQ